MARQPGERNVINLLRFRESRQKGVLPLFDDSPAPRLVTIAPCRVLSAREISHRARMLQHLKAVPSRSLEGRKPGS
jgi:hypothetical protein